MYKRQVVLCDGLERLGHAAERIGIVVGSALYLSLIHIYLASTSDFIASRACVHISSLDFPAKLTAIRAVPDL